MSFIFCTIPDVLRLLKKHQHRFYAENCFSSLSEIALAYNTVLKVIDTTLQKKEESTYTDLLQILLIFSCYCRVLGRVDDVTSRLKLAQSLFLSEKKFEYFVKISLELANVFKLKNEYTEAFFTYKDMLKTMGAVPGASLHFLLPQTGKELNLSIDSNLLLLIMRAYVGLSDVLRVQGYLQESLVVASESKELERLMGGYSLIESAQISTVLGHAQLAAGDSVGAQAHYVMALGQYTQANSCANEHQGVILLGQLNVNLYLGDVFLAHGDNDQARNHYEKGFNLAHKISDSQGIANAQLCLIRLELCSTRFEKSLIHKISGVQAAYRIRHDLIGAICANIVLGDYYVLMGEENAAKRSYKDAQDICYRIDAQGLLAIAQARSDWLGLGALDPKIIRNSLERRSSVCCLS